MRSTHQRTANWVLPKEDTPFDEETLAELQANPISVRRRRWKLWRELNLFTQFNDTELLGRAERAGLRNLALVQDPEVRAALTPTEPYGCKRPLISNDWYPTFNLPQVELVTEPIERVTVTGVATADGVERRGGHDHRRHRVPGAALPLGARRDRPRQVDLRTPGPTAPRPRPCWGITAGFPNLFMLYGPNTNQGSIIYMIECQVAYIVRQVQRLQDEDLVWLDVKPEVQAAYNEELQAELERFDVWKFDCNHYYRSPSGRIVTQFPGDMANYRDRTSAPDAEAFEVHAGRPFGTRVRRLIDA
ncbi:MAG: hypothetical protein R2749_04785 [Acidimicrobiales bacterium]